jgi:hypothetical protein
MEVANADPDNRHAAVQSMVTPEDARWLAGYLRKMISTRPAAWAGTEMTLASHQPARSAPIASEHASLGAAGPAPGCAALRVNHREAEEAEQAADHAGSQPH